MATRTTAKANEKELAYMLKDWNRITRPFRQVIWVKKYKKGVKILNLGE